MLGNGSSNGGQYAGISQENENNTIGRGSAIARADDVFNVAIATGALNIQLANIAINAQVNANLLNVIEQENEIEKELDVNIED